MLLKAVLLSYFVILLSLSGCAIGMAALYGAVSGAATYYIENELLAPATLISPPCYPGSHHSGAFCIFEETDFESPTKKTPVKENPKVPKSSEAAAFVFIG